MYARFKRFHHALSLLNEPSSKSWLEIAHLCGYYDQAHLTRDFRLFAGIGPARYLREAREIARNFIADAGET